MGKTVVIMKQFNMNGIVERSSAMMEVLNIETEMFYRGYFTDVTAYDYQNGGFRINMTIYCDNYSEQCEIAQYLENHPAKHQGTIKPNTADNNYWVSYEIVH